jgi:hypothetical protein
MRPPFPCLCHQEPIPWFGDYIDGSVILLHSHGSVKHDTKHLLKAWIFFPNNKHATNHYIKQMSN